MTNSAETLTATAGPLPALDALEPRWRALEAAAEGSFFTGWTWMGSWLRATGARPELVSVRDEAGVEQGLALLGRGREQRRLGAPWTLRLNEAAEPAADRAFIEYNAPLARAGREASVTAALGAHLSARRDWRVLRLSGVEPGSALAGLVGARRRTLVDRAPAHGVALEPVRAAGGDYLSLLSANTRGQIRRSLRDHGNAPATVRRATSAAEVEAGLAEMARLNAGRHADNAWDAPLFRAFAQEIALAGLSDGTVDLLSVHQGADRIGLLLNFVHRGRAMNYQSAFEPPVSAKAKPGLMTHAAAVAHYAGAGLEIYSFLAGKDRYKESLGTMAETLEWWALERFSPALEAEYWLRRVLGR